MYELINIFDTFLPQLLLYPNPADPLNPEAAKLMKEDYNKYCEYIRSHVKTNACKSLSEKTESNSLVVEVNKKKDEDANSELSNASIELDKDLDDW